uniref:HMA domain-containing protein n=1 Tax=Kalanchoe fedtschenkoi TaxID=63787 RepID=A0A7N0T6R9_KALFE
MGIGGTIEYFYDIVKSNISGSKQVQQYQTVDLHCKVDCDGCERKLKKALNSLDGVTNVEINRKQQKISVTGCVEAEEVLKRAKRTGLRVQMWQFVPYNLVSEPYHAKMYDKKAPAGFVRKVIENEAIDEPYLTMFSDENPDSCSIM